MIEQRLFDKIQKLVPMVGVEAFVTREDGRFLIVKRNVNPNKGTWSLVGGLLDRDEDLKEAIKREIIEETGLKVIGIPVMIGVTNRTQPERHVVVINFVVHVIDAGVKLNYESTEHKWVKELPAVMNRHVKEMYNKFLTYRSGN